MCPSPFEIKLTAHIITRFTLCRFFRPSPTQGKTLQKKAIVGVTTVAVFLSALIAALNIIGMSDLSAMLCAAFYLFVMIFYFVAGGKLTKQLGAGNPTAKRITVRRRNGEERAQWCAFMPPYLLHSNISISFSSPSLLKILINRLALALLGGLLSMALYFVLNMIRKQSNMLLTTAIGGFFIFLIAPLSFAVGHHFLLQFLNASLLKKSNSKVAASSAAASTGKNTAWTGQTGGFTGVTVTNQGETTMSPESETCSLKD